MAGARYDYLSRYEGTLNPRAAVIIRPQEGTTVKLLSGTAFQAPSLFYQYEQWGSESAVQLSVEEIRKTEPKWELLNQKIITHEIAVSQNIGTHANLNISVYHHVLKDLIERVVYADSVYNKYISTADSVYSLGFRNENIGKQNITGADIRLDTKISGNLRAHASYSYIDAVAEEDTIDVKIARVADHKVWVGLTWRNLFDHLTISPRLKWVGNINTVNTDKNPDGTLVYPDGTQSGYTTFDVTVTAVNLMPKTRFYAHINNLFDSDIEHGGLFKQGGGYTPTIPQPGINLRVGVEVSF